MRRITFTFLAILFTLSANVTLAQGPWRGFVLVRFVGWPDGMNLAQQAQVVDAFALLCPLEADLPEKSLQYRWNLSLTEILVECEWPQVPDAASIHTALASQLGYIEPYIAANTEIEPFAPGESWEASADAARVYLAAHLADWEPPASP